MHHTATSMCHQVVYPAERRARDSPGCGIDPRTLRNRLVDVGGTNRPGQLGFFGGITIGKP